MKYVLLFIDTEAFSKELADMDEASRAAAYGAVDAWFAEHRSKIIGGSHLAGPESATTVRVDGPEPVVLDGPYVESKEVVSGYTEIEVDDLDEAIAMAKSWPACPVVEIRPIVG